MLRELGYVATVRKLVKLSVGNRSLGGGGVLDYAGEVKLA